MVAVWCRLLALLLLIAATPLEAQSRRPYPATRYGGNYMHNYLFAPTPGATPSGPA